MLLAALNDCTIPGPNPCVTDAGPGWTGHGFHIDVQQPSICPVRLNIYGQYQDFESVVKAGDGEPQPSTNLITDIVNDHGFLQNSFSEGWSLDSDNRFTSVTIGAWYIGTVGSAGADTADAATAMPTAPTLVHAMVSISYTQEVLAAINGPTSLPGGGTVNLTAFAQNGKTPFGYHWYRDGVTVGNNSSSLSMTLGPAVHDYHFSVTITDAEGDMGQGTKTVSVTSGTCVVPPCP